MRNHHDIINYVAQSVFKLMSGSITEIEFAKLEDILIHDEVARKHYYELNYVITAMKNTEGILGLEEVLKFDMNLLHDMAEYEKTAPEIKIQEESSRELMQKVVYPPREKRKVSKFSITFLAMSAAAILFFVLFLKFAPPKGGVEVATLSDSINAKWADIDASMQNGTRLATTHNKLMLREGIAELTFDNHAKAIIEAPTEFQILADDRINLNYGKVYVAVPKKAIGFSVYTLNAKVIDLGTEFGVQADSHGDTQLYVFKGKTSLIAGRESKRTSMEVTKDTAKRVSGVTQEISDIPCKHRLFVREINSADKLVWRGESEIRLADIVGGGNGLGTGRIQNSIDPATGDMVAWEIPRQNTRTGTNQYLPVNASDFIDGVFVPDGGEGSIQVTSLGDRWDAPDTSNYFKYNIVNSLRIPADVSEYENYSGFTPKEDVILEKTLQGNVPLRLLGLMANNTPSKTSDTNILMHSNLGITFNLNQIRTQLPNAFAMKFKSLFGVGEITSEGAQLDMWVLVDGQVKYHKQNVTAMSSVDINVELSCEDHFLTLVVTEGDQHAYDYDWGLFMNPRLEIN